MKAIITNKFIVIRDCSPELRSFLKGELAFKDKAKAYQLKRMANNPFLKKSQQYKDLQQEINGTLYKEMTGGHPVIPSGFVHLLPNTIDIDDKRTLTGKTISLPWVKQLHSLRPYQEEAVIEMENNYRGLINLATGLGKTALTVHAIRRIKKKTLIVVPSESIAQQFIDVLSTSFGPQKVGLFGSGKHKINDITVGIAASVNNHIDKFKAAELGLVVFDETHHIAASTFYNIVSHLGDVGKIFGLTATDYRQDGKDIFITGGVGRVLIRRDVKWGIDNGYLAKPYFIMKEIETSGRDYRDNKLQNYKAHVLNDPQMNRVILEDAREQIAKGRTVLILVDEIAHGEFLSKQLNCPFAQGEDKLSQGYVELLNAKKINCLVGTDGKISEGTDTKSVDCILLANFVAGKGPVIQSIGRGLRIIPGKIDCLIIDYKPLGSTMLSRHADNRLDFYKEITQDVVEVVV